MPTTTSYNPILVAEEVIHLLENDEPLRARLERVVGYLKKATRVDSLSIYRYSTKTGDLYLESTEGLSKDQIGQLALRRGEGLTGLVIRSRKPLAVRDGPSHPNFRYVVGSNEEKFHSYLGVPIENGKRVIGALVAQTRKPRDFGREDIALLNTVARHIGNVTAPIFRRLDRGATAEEESGVVKGARAIKGRTLAPGCFLGEPQILDLDMRLERVFIPPSRGAEAEIKAIRKANREVRADLERDAKSISGSEGYNVLMAHRVMLEDEELAKEVLNHIENGKSAAEAIRTTALRWIHILEKQPDPAFAARSADFRDIATRLLRALGVGVRKTNNETKRIVAIAHVILPGDLIRNGPDRIGAIVMTDQGIFSHTSILARSFGIPAIQVEGEHLNDLLRAKRLLVDGTEGIAVIDPTDDVAQQYIGRSEKIIAIPETGPQNLRGKVHTPDGVPVLISLNAGLLSDFEKIETYAPDEIGLCRTEFPFMSERVLPGPKAQTSYYQKVVQLSGGRKVVFRTFDFGGDKLPASLRFEREDNPMMGCRSTRFMLTQPELLRNQLRALLTASAGGRIAILVPMVSTPEEFNLVLDELNAVKNELDREGVPFDRKIPVGIMLEVPSLIFAIEQLSRSADFYSVGTNDLVQYLMAADRSNPAVARLYQWHHPSVLLALDYLFRQCHKYGKPVTICGEMANHPWAAMVLVGMGFSHLSVDYHSIPMMKWVLLQASGERMQRLALSAMQATSSTEVIEIFYGELAELKKESAALAEYLRTSLDRLRMHAPW